MIYKTITFFFATVLVSSSTLWAPIPPPPQTTVDIYNHTDSLQEVTFQTRESSNEINVPADHEVHFAI
ncbi:MAG: hypothetical protein K2P93_05315 [Alphaproteobacteria bacterium]|nr:hypothetical protein [Alphaproteobacteria bacterium]